MRLTKLGHSCVRLEKDGANLVIDPGVWSGADPLAGANALLITHEHVDHIDAGVVRAALERDSSLELWTVGAVAEDFPSFGGRVHIVGHGDAFTAAGFDVHVHGREHAPIYPGMPVVANVGFAIDGNVFHPGDAFTVPDEPVKTLLLPISAPWLKTSEMLDYAKAVRPQINYAIHDELLNANGIGLVEMLAGAFLGDAGTYARLEPGASADI
ncbi:MAG TPA: MBL fold metallo-hydrolase [Streptosporangiaceae bacterium]|nr:MBL fold metallo-hydrolase [Streptosporangiaceae bacterium]